MKNEQKVYCKINFQLSKLKLWSRKIKIKIKIKIV